jgi:hypothetical protein
MRTTWVFEISAVADISAEARYQWVMTTPHTTSRKPMATHTQQFVMDRESIPPHFLTPVKSLKSSPARKVCARFAQSCDFSQPIHCTLAIALSENGVEDMSEPPRNDARSLRGGPSSPGEDTWMPAAAQQMVFAWDDSDRGGEEQSHTFGTAWQYPPHRLAARHRLAAATAAAPTSSDASSLMSSSLASRWSNTNGFPDVALDTTKIVSLLGTDGLPWATAGTTTPAKAGLDDVGTDGTVGGIPLYPRRLWSVSDTKLPRFPSTWPQPVNAVQVDRSTPAAVIAIRIASCLARRSVAVDYDDDAATAYGVTIDQCHLAVHLWRRPKRNGAGPDDGELLDTDTVMVECRRIRGSVQTFHRTAVAIFEAAQGLDSGADRRSLHQTAPTEYPRLLGQASFASLHSIARSGDLDGAEMDSSSEARESASDEISDSQMAMEALELAFSFLGKDRWDAQSWGMYCLATLVDASVTRKSVAICAALRLLAATDTGTSTTTSADKDSNSLILQQLQTNWIFNIIVTRQLPSEKDLQKEVDPYAFLTAPSGHDEETRTMRMILNLRLWMGAAISIPWMISMLGKCGPWLCE